MTSKDSGNVTFSAAFSGGPKLSSLRVGEESAGPAVVPVSRSPSLAKGKAKTTNETSGPSSFASSKPVGRKSSSGSKSHPQTLSERSLRLLSLTRFKGAITQRQTERQTNLSSCLRSRIPLDGSIEYSLIWKRKVTPAGRVIYRLQASARRTSASDCTGWPTPAVQNADGGVNPQGNTGEHFTLQTAAAMAGWPSPDSSHHGALSPEAALKRVTSHRNGGPKRSANLDDVAVLAGWPTPQTCEAPNMSQNRGDGKCRARTTPQSVVGLVGWPSPTAMSFNESHQPGNNRYMNATMELVGWNAPRAADGTNGGPNQSGGALPADAAKALAAPSLDAPGPQSECCGTEKTSIEESISPSVMSASPGGSLSGWATPAARDYKSEVATNEYDAARDSHARGKPLSYEATRAIGPTTNSSPAQTGRRGVLNADHSRWLMGFPATWDEASPGFAEWQSVQEVIASDD